MCDEEGKGGREVRKHQEKAQVKMDVCAGVAVGEGHGSAGEGGRRMEGIEVKMSLQS